MCRLPHFVNYAYSFHKKAAALIGQPPALTSQREPLARASKGDNIHGRERPAVKPGNIPHMGHVREVALCDRHALRHDLTGPQRTDTVKRSGIGKPPYAVKERA